MDSPDPLLNYVRSHPDDWRGWLVLADWLSERGVAGGELIQVEHRLATAALSADERSAEEARARVLGRQVRDRCLQGLSLPPGSRLQWRCGFVVGMELLWDDRTLELLATLCDHPAGRLLTSLTLHGPVGPEGARALSLCPLLERIRTLELGRTALGDEGARALARSPHLGALTSLALGHDDLGLEGARALARSEELGSLESLALAGNRLGDEGAAALAGSRLVRLQRLILRDNGLGDAGARALAGTSLPLEHLDLGNTSRETALRNRIRADGVAQIAQSLGQLRHLNLEFNPIGDEGALALARSPRLGRLRHLDLMGCGLGSRGIAALAGSELSELEVLVLKQNALGEEGAQAWATSPLRLKKLFLTDCDLDLWAAQALARSPSLASLTTLYCGNNPLGDEGVRALLASASFEGLEMLSIGGCSFGMEGLEAILEGAARPATKGLHLSFSRLGTPLATALAAAGLAHLEELSLVDNRIGTEGAEILASAGLAHLATLHLQMNGLGPEGAQALASSETLPRLARLDLGGNEIRSRGAIALARSPQRQALATLALRRNYISNDAAFAFATSELRQELAVLDLSANPIGQEGRAALAASVPLRHCHVITASPLPAGRMTVPGP
jgi:uncharacterized protein (TIGR02996 family)